MFKKLAMMGLMFSGAALLPVTAAAQNYDYGHRNYYYQGDRRWDRHEDRREWRERERDERRAREWRRQEWRERERWERRFDRRHYPDSYFYFRYGR